jgi:putative ABC transport system permease protein
MFDFLHEIMATIRRNKMRTFLTGFAVAWGIFLLIILLGAGNGLRNGVMSNFGSQGQNQISINTGRTSMPYGGYQAGRVIRFDDRDIDLLRHKIPNIGYLSAGRGRTATLTRGDEYGSWFCDGVTQDEQFLFDVKIYRNQGRFINNIDVTQRRKVIVLSNLISEVLFGEQNPVGRYVEVDQTAFQVIGVFDDENRQDKAYIPFTTAQMLWFGGWGVSWIGFTVSGLNSEAEIDAFDENLRKTFATFHRFDPKDRSAMYLYSGAKEALSFRKVFTGINIFILIIGVASMMAGIIGVGNIMLITVRERTREIGIRKAIGATPLSILQLIIFEAVFIMTVSGYVGILLGIGVTEAASKLFFSGTGGENNMITFFLNPTVEMGTVIGATLFLIVCGTFAGLIPALKATRVRPIEAMRAE